MAGRVHAIRNGIVAAALAALSAWPSQAETIDIIDDRGGSSINYVARPSIAEMGFMYELPAHANPSA